MFKSKLKKTKPNEDEDEDIVYGKDRHDVEGFDDEYRGVGPSRGFLKKTVGRGIKKTLFTRKDKQDKKSFFQKRK